MEPSREQILELLHSCLDQLNEQRGPADQLAKAPETRLAGAGGNLDSLGFVNLVAMVEEGCQDRWGRTVMLTGSSPTPEGRDPFETVGSLGDYLGLVLAGRAGEWR